MNHIYTLSSKNLHKTLIICKFLPEMKIGLRWTDFTKDNFRYFLESTLVTEMINKLLFIGTHNQVQTIISS